MKNKLMSVCCILPIIAYGSSQVAISESTLPFTSYYLGVGGGANMQFFQSNYFDHTEGTNHWINFGNNGGSGNLYAGFNFPFRSNLLIGLDGHTQYNWTAAAQHKHNNIPSFDSSQLLWQFGISPKLGYVHNNTLYYLLAGPEWAKLKHSDVSDTGTYGTDNKYLFGGLFGFGLSQNIMKNLNLTEQFGYGIFQNTSYTLKNSDKSTLNNPTDVTVTLALEYHFG